jgi:hypothetical protein
MNSPHYRTCQSETQSPATEPLQAAVVAEHADAGCTPLGDTAKHCEVILPMVAKHIFLKMNPILECQGTVALHESRTRAKFLRKSTSCIGTFAHQA